VSQRTIAVIACGVMEWNIGEVEKRIPGTRFVNHILPAQLHENPGRLRELLQAKIEELEQEAGLAGIVIGFGRCGRGTIGVISRRAPLVLPRVHDCIGLYLGSHSRYMQEFQRSPGTRYLTRGWYDKTIKTQATQRFYSPRDASLYGVTYDELARRYGDENAQFVCEFRESWKRNYRRAVYIRFAGEEELPAGERITRGLAETLNWEHQVLHGDDSLLFAMLNGDWDDPRILVVPPHNKTVAAPGDAIVAFTAGVDSHVERTLKEYQRSHRTAQPERSGLGLGIDTGGTFTDAVIFDFATGAVQAHTKAPTTHEALIVGVRNALRQLPAEQLRAVTRVGMSTTLATNAMVENKGRPVGLLLMAPIDVDPSPTPFRYVRKIEGAMNLDGDELAPINPIEVTECARQAQAAGCEAVAVSGFAGVVNPAHELAVAQLVRDAVGLPTVCGHELTSELDFTERATTAAMNARLIPLLEHLLDAVRRALSELGLPDVRVMVVKGDGSQMLDRVARQFPVQTILSGPAASAVGAARLFSNPDAVVVDMGGTSLDVAVLRDRAPVLNRSGARVAGFKTSIRAMAVQTIGLGGDSEIDLAEWPKVTLGPRRVIPFCRLPETFPDWQPILDGLSRGFMTCETHCADLVTPAPGVEPEGFLLGHLRNAPLFLAELAWRMSRASPSHIPWREMEDNSRLRRYALTITDILHWQNRFDGFDRRPAARMLEFWSTLLSADIATICDAVYHEFRRMVCDTVISVAVPPACPWDQPTELRQWLTRHLTDTDREPGLQLRLDLGCPLIAVGAPAPTLFPDLQPVFNRDILISEFAGVANAIGAIAGDVLLRESAAVRITAEGTFLCSWRGGNAHARDLGDALRKCETALRELLRDAAAANDIPFLPPVFSAIPHQAETRDGTLLLGVTLQGELRG